MQQHLEVVRWFSILQVGPLGWRSEGLVLFSWRDGGFGASGINLTICDAPSSTSPNLAP